MQRGLVHQKVPASARSVSTECTIKIDKPFERATAAATMAAYKMHGKKYRCPSKRVIGAALIDVWDNAMSYKYDGARATALLMF